MVQPSDNVTSYEQCPLILVTSLANHVGPEEKFFTNTGVPILKQFLDHVSVSVFADFDGLDLQYLASSD